MKNTAASQKRFQFNGTGIGLGLLGAFVALVIWTLFSFIFDFGVISTLGTVALPIAAFIFIYRKVSGVNDKN